MSDLPAAVADSMPPDDELVIGTVVSGNPLVVSARGANITGAGRLSSAGLAAGDSVALHRQDNTWLVLGKITAPTGNGFGTTTVNMSAASALLPLTAAETDIAGTTMNFTTLSPRGLLLAWWTADYESLAAASPVGVCKLSVDGVIQPGQAIYNPGGSATGRVTASQTDLVPLGAGSHTVLLRGNRVGGADLQLRINALHTTLTIMVLE